MKTLKWIAAAIVVSLALGAGAAMARDRDDDGLRFNCRPYYGDCCVGPFYGYGVYERPGYYVYSRRDGNRDRWENRGGRWDRDRDLGRYARHDDHRGGFRFGFGF